MTDDPLTADRIRRRIGAKLDLSAFASDKASEDHSTRSSILERLRALLIKIAAKNTDAKR